MNKTIDQLMQELQAPFKEEELGFKVGATNAEKTMGLALCYVEARAIQNRLDQVVGFTNWKVSYREVKDGFLCCMSLKVDGDWISKEDGARNTNYEAIKGGISSAFKRVAASGWGIGRYLYDVRNQWFPIKQNGKNYIFTEKPIINFEKSNEVIKTTPDKNNNLNKLQKAKSMQVNFGKYSGKTLEEIYGSDKNYFKYLIQKGRDEKLVNACRYIESREELMLIKS